MPQRCYSGSVHFLEITFLIIISKEAFTVWMLPQWRRMTVISKPFQMLVLKRRSFFWPFKGFSFINEMWMSSNVMFIAIGIAIFTKFNWIKCDLPDFLHFIWNIHFMSSEIWNVNRSSIFRLFISWWGVDYNTVLRFFSTSHLLKV